MDKGANSVEQHYYVLESDSNTVLNRIWDYVESTRNHMCMYKTRIGITGTVKWVIQMPNDKLESYFLLQFAQYVNLIAKPNYYVY